MLREEPWKFWSCPALIIVDWPRTLKKIGRVRSLYINNRDVDWDVSEMKASHHLYFFWDFSRIYLDYLAKEIFNPLLSFLSNR